MILNFLSGLEFSKPLFLCDALRIFTYHNRENYPFVEFFTQLSLKNSKID
jgi:hypothetical protein